MKIIVVGPSLSGKTTLVKFLRSNQHVRVGEIDEELVSNNGGSYPTDLMNKHDVLAPAIVEEVLGLDNIIFFTNTNYFTFNDIERARKSGFKIIQLLLSREQLEKRNKDRIENEGYEDQSKWFPGMIEYTQQLKDKKLVDKIIDANLTTEKIASEILNSN